MRKTAMITALLILLMFPIHTSAASMRSPNISAGLTFTGTSANCAVTVLSRNSKDSITLTVKLWQGDTCLETWSETATGQLRFSKTKTVSRGKSYTMTADAVIDGEEIPTVSVTKECP